MIDNQVRAAFSEVLAALRVALDLPGLLAAEKATAKLHARLAVHQGPAVVATVDDRLDYFGSTVQQAVRLPAWARADELILTQVVASDPRVDALLRGRGLVGELLQADLPGQAGILVQRLRLPACHNGPGCA